MKPCVPFALVLMFGISLAAQQDHQPENIPNWDASQKTQVTPIPNWNPAQDAPAHPIPNWMQPEPISTTTSSSVLTMTAPSRVCAIVKEDGRAYDYIEGTLPKGMKPQDKLSAKSIRKILKSGESVKILGSTYSREEFQRAKLGCSVDGAAGVSPYLLPPQR